MVAKVSKLPKMPDLLKDLNWFKFVLIAGTVALIVAIIGSIICIILSILTQIGVYKKSAFAVAGLSITQLIFYFIVVILVVATVLVISAAEIVQEGSVGINIVKNVAGGFLGISGQQVTELPGKVKDVSSEKIAEVGTKFAQSDTGQAIGKKILSKVK